MFTDQETLVVWNPSAGSSALNGELKSRLESIAEIELVETTSRAHCVEQVQQACERGVPTVIASGGDGTVNSVLEGIVRSGEHPVMGILPCGTGNDFARSLGIEMNPLVAFDQLLNGTVRQVDAVRYVSSGREGWYLNMLTGGNTGVYMNHLTDEIKRRWGAFSYLRGVIDVAQNLLVFDIEVSLDDGPPESFQALNVFLANGRMSGGGMTICSQAVVDDGQVDLIVVKDGPAGEIVSLTTDYLVADYLEHHLVEHRTARRIAIQSKPAMPLTADGDTIAETKLTVEVLPQSLSTLVPATDTLVQRAKTVR